MRLDTEPLFRHLAEHSLVGIYIIQDGRYAHVNPRLAEIFGYSVTEVLALENWIELIAPPDRMLVAEQVRRRLNGEAETSRYSFRGLRRDGTVIDVEVYGSVTQVNGRPAAVGNLIDITERKRVEEKLERAQQRLQYVVSSSPTVLYTLGIRDGRIQGITWMSENIGKMMGYAPEDTYGSAWWFGHLHPEDRDWVAAETNRELFAHGRVTNEYRFRHGDGTYRWVRSEKRLAYDAAGRPAEAIGSWLEITESKQIEEQLRQAQKMEAIGVLAGGVAHDFNNLLTVINGYSEVIVGDRGLAPSSRDMVREIHRAGDQAASLTRQLLAFSRKQLLAPQVVDPNVLVRETAKMLRRLIGADIDFATALDPDLGRIMADPGQIEQVLMNLVVNARDAMPTGGKLTIETRNVELAQDYSRMHLGVKPGSYVVIAVTDTGVGMDAATRARIFEPFFTTKEPGKGTGLGLATVHGIVQQSGGHVEVYSEPGRGTSFKIYLPQLATEPSALAAPPSILEVPRGSETILLAEDEGSIRNLVRISLQLCGYKLLEAANGEEALNLGSLIQPPLHLLLTDVVMPKMSGRELAEGLRSSHPAMKVLYMSGYTDDAIVRHGVVAEGVAFLQKPFTPTTLARKVREVLDGSPSRFS